MKRFISIVLTILLVASSTIVPAYAAETSKNTTGYSLISENEFQNKLSALKSVYPEKSSPDYTYYENGTPLAWTCVGFANKLAYYCFGSSQYTYNGGWSKSYDSSYFNAGDIVRVDGDGHTIFITYVNGSNIRYAEGNFNWPAAGYNSAVRWDVTTTLSNLQSRFTYKMHLSGNNLTGTNPGGKYGIDCGDDFYALILNQPAWKPIGQTDSGNVEIMTESKFNYNRTLWHFVKRDNSNAYRIYSVLNGKCLDVSGGSSAEGTNVQCWESNDSQAQYWYYMLKNNNGAFTAGCTPYYMDMSTGSSSDGTNIQMWTWNGTDAQKFSYYQVTPQACGLDYSIAADSYKLDADGTTKITVGGTLSYVYSYKFHVIDPDGKETVIDNGCNPVFDFKPELEGEYTVFAEIKNPYNTQKGSTSERCVKITVGCVHKYTDTFVEAKKDGDQGYILHTCSNCGKRYEDNYMDYKGGWYYSETLPDMIKSNSKYTVQYDNYYEKIQKDSPGSDWTKTDTVKNEWKNKGGQYDSYTELSTSDSRILVKECYYHWCIPNSAMGSEGNYEQTDKFSHYDEIVLPNTNIHVTWTGNDNGHTVYTLAWLDGNAVYCKSGEQCNGTWGSHDYRCRAWYKKYVYQDREKIEIYKYTRNSGWMDSLDSNATKTVARFRLAGTEIPTTTEPVITEPVESSTTVTIEPTTTEPVESSTTVTIEPTTTEPVESSTVATTEPVTTEPAESSTAATTEPVTTEPAESSTAATTESVTEAPTTEPQPTVCKHSHTKTTTKAATYFAKGKKTITCTACGKVLKTTSIAKKVLKTPSVTIKGAKKSIKVTLKKKVKDATGFIVKYQQKGKKKVVTKKYKTNKKVTKVIKKLKKNKKYTVKVKAYVQKGKKIAYSKWKTVKTVKTK